MIVWIRQVVGISFAYIQGWQDIYNTIQGGRRREVDGGTGLAHYIVRHTSQICDARHLLPYHQPPALDHADRCAVRLEWPPNLTNLDTFS